MKPAKKPTPATKVKKLSSASKPSRKAVVIDSDDEAKDEDEGDKDNAETETAR